LLELPLREVMWAEPGSPRAALLEQTGYTQPALFAFEWALAALWRSWGVEPGLLLGHSVGQLTAAAVAGVFSLESGARLVAARARLMQALAPGGAMISLAAPEEVVREALAAVLQTVAVAAVNAPASVVISGAEADVLRVAEQLAARGVQSRRLAVSHAFHSPLMEPMLEAFQRVAESVSYQPRASLWSRTPPGRSPVPRFPRRGTGSDTSGRGFASPPVCRSWRAPGRARFSSWGRDPR